MADCNTQFTPTLEWACVSDIAASLKSGEWKAAPMATMRKAAWVLGCAMTVADALPAMSQAEADEAAAKFGTLEDCAFQLNELTPCDIEEGQVAAAINPVSVFVLIRTLLSIIEQITKLNQ